LETYGSRRDWLSWKPFPAGEVLSVENVQLNGVRAVLRLAGKNGSLATARAVL